MADDAVEIRRISNSLFGTAPEIIRHYIEIRGVGVIDVQQLFGMGAVQFDTEIDLVIQLEQWIDGKFYDRLGLGEEKYRDTGRGAAHRHHPWCGPGGTWRVSWRSPP